MSHQVLWLIIGVVVVLAIELKRKILKKPYSYWAFISLTLTILSVVMAGRRSILLQIAGYYLFLIFTFLTLYVHIAGIESAKRPVFDEVAFKEGKLSRRHRWIAHFLSFSYKHSRIVKFLAGLSAGFVPAFFVILIAATLLAGVLGAVLDDIHTVAPQDHVSPAPNTVPPGLRADLRTLVCSAAIGASFIVGIVTLSVTFIFGCFIAEDRIPVGSCTGLLVGLVFSSPFGMEAVCTRIYITAICVLSGYFGGNLGLWIRKIIGTLRNQGYGVTS